jgi:hypothetical protein
VARKIEKWKQYLKKHRRRIAAWTVFYVAAVAALLIVVQVAWPYNRFLPFQKIDGFAVGLKTYDEASAALTKAYNSHEVDLTVTGRTVGKTTVKDIGVKVDVAREIDAAKMSLRERFIPGMIFYKMFSAVATPPKVALDTPTTAAYLDRNYATICTISPVNATLTVSDNRLKLTNDEPGLLCDEKKFLGNILADNLTLAHPLTVKMDGKAISALVTAASLQSLYDTTRSQLTRGVVFDVSNGQSVAARYLDVVHWLNIETDVFGGVKVSYSDDKIRDYLTSNVAPLVAQQPGITVVNELNGVEISRKLGTTGRELDYDAEIAAVKDYLANNTESGKKLAVATLTAAPSVQYKRSFSKNAGGFAALFSNRLAGSEHSLVVDDQDLLRGWSDAVNADTTFSSKLAGRLIVPYLMAKTKYSNTAAATTASDYNTDVVKKFIADTGRSKIDQLTGELGGHTTLADDGTVTTSASDLASVLKMIKNNDSLDFSDALESLAADSTLHVNNDASDPLMAVQYVSGDDGDYIIVAATTSSRANLSDTLSYISAIFTPEDD